MKSAQIIEPNKPLQINEVEISKPSGNEVIVKVKSAGVCHSDLHLWEGGYDTGDGFMKVTDRGVKFPVIPGHEVVGVVEEVGDSVQAVSIGDVVLVYPCCRIGDLAIVIFSQYVLKVLSRLFSFKPIVIASYYLIRFVIKLLNLFC